jgi:hypothetical protein
MSQLVLKIAAEQRPDNTNARTAAWVRTVIRR